MTAKINYIHIRRPIIISLHGWKPEVIGLSNLGGATIAYNELTKEYSSIKVNSKDNYCYATGRNLTFNIITGLESGTIYSVAPEESEAVGVAVMRSYLTQIDTRKCLAIYGSRLVLIDATVASLNDLRIIAVN